MAASPTTIRLRIQGLEGVGGSPFEVIPAVALDEPGTFRLLNSPGMALGTAAGDVVRVAPNGDFQVIERAGNLCVQVFAPEQNRDACQDFLRRGIEALGGRLDGASRSVWIFTVHLDAGFPAVEKLFKAAVARFPGTDWMFGNVYQPADGKTPLDWWQR